MKKMLVLSLLLICLTGTAFEQPDTSRRHMNDRELGLLYLDKSRQQKNAAWVLLLGGVVFTTVGAAIWADNWWDEGDDTGTMLLAYGGQIAAIASVPLFISAAKNKGRAEILLRYENIPMSVKAPGKAGLASVGLALPLGGR